MEKPLSFVSQVIFGLFMAHWLHVLSPYVRKPADLYQLVLFAAGALPLAGGMYQVYFSMQGEGLLPRHKQQYARHTPGQKVDYAALQICFLSGVFAAYLWICPLGMPLDLYRQPSLAGALTFVFAMLGVTAAIRHIHRKLTGLFFWVHALPPSPAARQR